METSNNVDTATLVTDVQAGTAASPVGGQEISAVLNIVKSLMPDSKAAKNAQAMKAIAAGQYWTLRPYLKNMEQIPQYVIDQVKGQNIAYFAIIQLPAQGVGASNNDIIKQLQAMTAAGRDAIAGIDPTAQSAKPEALLIVGSEGTAVQPGSAAASAGTGTSATLTKYLPYIIGAIVLGIIIFLIVKHKRS